MSSIDFKDLIVTDDKTVDSAIKHFKTKEHNFSIVKDMENIFKLKYHRLCKIIGLGENNNNNNDDYNDFNSDNNNKNIHHNIHDIDNLRNNNNNNNANINDGNNALGISENTNDILTKFIEELDECFDSIMTKSLSKQSMKYGNGYRSNKFNTNHKNIRKKLSRKLSNHDNAAINHSILELVKTHELFFQKLSNIKKKITVLMQQYSSKELDEFMEMFKSIIEAHTYLDSSLKLINEHTINRFITKIGKLLIKRVPDIGPYKKFYLNYLNNEKALIMAIEMIKKTVKTQMDQEYSLFFIRESLLSPLQNITRFPLLIKNIISKIREKSGDCTDLETALNVYDFRCKELNAYYGLQENIKIIKWLDENVRISNKTLSILNKKENEYLKNRYYDLKKHQMKIHDKTIFEDDRFILVQIIVNKNQKKMINNLNHHIRIFVTRDLLIMAKFPNNTQNNLPIDCKSIKSKLETFNKIYELSQIKFIDKYDCSFDLICSDEYFSFNAISNKDKEIFSKQLESYISQYKYDKLQLLGSYFTGEVDPFIMATIHHISIEWTKDIKPYLNIKFCNRSYDLVLSFKKNLIYDERVYLLMDNSSEEIELTLIDIYQNTLYNLCRANFEILYDSEKDESFLFFSKKLISTTDPLISVGNVHMIISLLKNIQ